MGAEGVEARHFHCEKRVSGLGVELEMSSETTLSLDLAPEERKQRMWDREAAEVATNIDGSS
jgi:hypothetical protein